MNDHLTMYTIQPDVMLRILAALLCVGYCVGEQTTPNVWGSRIVTAKDGSVVLHFDMAFINNTSEFIVYNDKVDLSYGVLIEGGKCVKKESKEIWSSLCTFANGKGSIKVENVLAQDKIAISKRGSKLRGDTITIFFVPGCKFAPPAKDKIILNESLPLSRFVANESYVPLRFAVDGNESIVSLLQDDIYLCTWKGVKLDDGDAKDCKTGIGAIEQTDLKYNADRNMRVLEKVFPRPTAGNKRQTIRWKTTGSFLSISIDGNQTGTSPEISDCKGEHATPKVWGSRIVTANEGSVALHFNMDFKNDTPRFEVSRKDLTCFNVTIADGKCIIKDTGKIWSPSCSYENGKGTITVKDVLAQRKLSIPGHSIEILGITITIFFVPGCDFEPSRKGGVILRESVPLSHFVGSKTFFPLRFAIDGNKSIVVLQRDNQVLCAWNGIKLKWGEPIDCGTGIGADKQTDLKYIAKKNMRILEKGFPKPNSANKIQHYKLMAAKSFLDVTVDGNQLGTSPETANCKVITTDDTTDTISPSGDATKTTIRITPSGDATSKTTSAGSTLTNMLAVNSGLLAAMMCLRG